MDPCTFFISDKMVKLIYKSRGIKLNLNRRICWGYSC